MGTNYVPTDVKQGFQSTTSINENNDELQEALSESLSRVGATPNDMQALLDMGGNDIINVNNIDAQSFSGNVTDQLQGYVDDASDEADRSATEADRSEAEANNSASSANDSSGYATQSAGYRDESLGYANQSAGYRDESQGYSIESLDYRDQTADLYDQFDDRYLGDHAVDPIVDNDGDPLITGALYFNTTDNTSYVYSGVTWIGVSNTQTSQDAQQSADDSAASAVESSGYADASEASSVTSDGFSQASSGFAQDSAASAVESSGYATDSLGYRDQSQGYSNDSLGYSQDSSNSASAASSSASSASGSATNALNSENKAFQWAEEAEDVEVDPGEYSAFHWAQKAEDAVSDDVTYKGSWDASGNVYPSNPDNGDKWIISVAGTLGGDPVVEGDTIIYATVGGWDNFDTGGGGGGAVDSVDGNTGVVELYDDYVEINNGSQTMVGGDLIINHGTTPQIVLKPVSAGGIPKLLLQDTASIDRARFEFDEGDASVNIRRLNNVGQIETTFSLQPDGNVQVEASGPNNPQDLTTMDYVDGEVNDLQSNIDLKADITYVDNQDSNLQVQINTKLSDINSESIDELADVDTTTSSPIVDDVLQWDGSNWVPAVVSGGGGGDFVLKTGDTMTGQLKGISPVSGDDMTVKSYVDSQDALKYDKTGGTVTGEIVMQPGVASPDFIIKTSSTSTGNPSYAIRDSSNSEVMYLKYDINNKYALLSAGSPGNQTSYVFQRDNVFRSTQVTPTLDNQYVQKHYVDTQDTAAVQKSGDTMTGDLLIEKDGATLTLKDTVGNPATINFEDSTTLAASVTSNSVNEQLRLRVYDTDGLNTLTVLTLQNDGNVTLTGGLNAPTAAADLTRKDYTDAEGGKGSITISTAQPSGGTDKDVWYVY